MNPLTIHELSSTVREETPTAEELLLDGMKTYVPNGRRTNIYGIRTVLTAREPNTTATRLNEVIKKVLAQVDRSKIFIIVYSDVILIGATCEKELQKTITLLEK